jgi:undecaprenyl-diphosphatase
VTAIIHAIILGIVEGLTEFLPISSTGHLIVAERAIGYKDAAETFTVVVQIGAMAAVVWHFRRNLWEKVTGLFRLEPHAKVFWLNLVIATLPAAAAGLLLEKQMDKYAVPATVAISLLLGGIVLLWAEARLSHLRHEDRLHLDRITPRQALGVGLAQIIALVPGVSRSGATIVGGMFAGLNRVTAAAFSFYLALPILGLASAYKLFKARHTLGNLPGGPTALIVGTAAAFLSALLVVKWLLGYISRHDFRPFAYYRIAFGCLLLLLIATGLLTNS